MALSAIQARLAYDVAVAMKVLWCGFQFDSGATVQSRVRSNGMMACSSIGRVGSRYSAAAAAEAVAQVWRIQEA